MRAWRVRTIVFCCALGLTVQSAARSAAEPSGRLAVTTVDRGGMWVAVVNTDGSGLRRVTAAPGHSVTPVWAPDGRRLAYTHIEGNEAQIYLINADGTGRRRITGSPGVALLPAWSPDRTPIAFVERIGRFEQQISTITPDGPGYRRFATGYAPAWSPDGRKVGFVVARHSDAQIYVANADGTAPLKLTPSSVNLLPTWSPDGTQLAFLARRNSDLALWVMRADGSNQRRLAVAAGDLSQLPVFSWQPQ